MSMDYEDYRKGTEKRVTVLPRDEDFFNRILSRNSSVGCSSGVFYCRDPDGVPFKWEMLPGTPKDPPKEEIIPPLSPPPALLSLGLPKPSIPLEPNKTSLRSKLKFWKKIKKWEEIKNVIQRRHESSGSEIHSAVGSNSFEFYSSDAEFMVSSARYSLSSSSSSVSFSNDHTLRSPRTQGPTRSSMNMPFTCSPWNFSNKIVKSCRKALTY